MHTILNINGSLICRHVSPSIWTSEYYEYCIRLLKLVLQDLSEPINIIFGDIVCDFNNTHRTIKIDIQSEHTLVKLGGRSVDEIIYGTVDYLDGNGKYLIRVPNYSYYSGLDATIEYSLPNIFNLKTNDKFADYIKKAIYIAPLIYDIIDFQAHHKTETISISNNSERRAELLKHMAVTNIQNIIAKDALKQVYDRTKIMVNIHQTDHHHTFEELRVLPALCNGVIIISEDVPLKETIPYSDSIIWAAYEDIPYLVKDVQENYDCYCEQIFTPQLETIIRTLQDNNIKNLLTNLL